MVFVDSWRRAMVLIDMSRPVFTTACDVPERSRLTLKATIRKAGTRTLFRLQVISMSVTGQLFQATRKVTNSFCVYNRTNIWFKCLFG